LDTVPDETKQQILDYAPHLLEKDSIDILKKTKKNEKIENIKPGILKLSVESYHSAKALAGGEGIADIENEPTAGNSTNDMDETYSSDKNRKKEVGSGNQYVADTEAKDKLYMLLATGSEYNLKPELVVQAICNELGLEYNRFDIKIHRLETYMKNDKGELVSLLESGTRME
jgi:hypothetical protein